MAKEENKNPFGHTSNVSQFSKGMSKDTSELNNPEGTYTYALNTINQTSEGDYGFISNEESNKKITSIKPDYIPIGKCYIGDNKTVIFSVNPKTGVSEIGVLENDSYRELVNDEVHYDEFTLNFKPTHQIQATYRLRRGCEHIIYFTDGLNPPRVFNITNPDFYKTRDKWNAEKFRLFRTSKKTPKLANNGVQVLEGSGQLEPGAYTILVQYLDEDLNPTEFSELVSNVYIYNESTKSSYSEILGSMKLEAKTVGKTEQEVSNFKYESTGKAIKVIVQNVDTDFTYLRFAFVKYTDGVGIISGVFYSDYISIYNPEFVYTGTNHNTKGTIEEVTLGNIGTDIAIAKHIEQIENRLLLANTQATQVKHHLLQKYASQIATDCVVEKVILNDVEDTHNPKNPLVDFNGIGYQPGEVYSFGIIYIYEDNTKSPVFHIPGKVPYKGTNDPLLKKVYSPGQNVFPMSNVGNTNSTEKYIDNASCNNQSFWGRDVEGNSLYNAKVRHHRFPTREELGIDFITNTADSEEYEKVTLTLSVKVDEMKKSKKCDDPNDPNCIPYQAPTYQARIKYTTVDKNNVETQHTSDIVYISPDTDEKYVNFELDTLYSNTLYKVPKNDEDTYSDAKLVLEISEDFSKNNPIIKTINITDTAHKQPLLEYNWDKVFNYKWYKTAVQNDSNDIDHKAEYWLYFFKKSVENVSSDLKYYGNIFGVKFSNIIIPPNSKELLGKRIVGYQFVRLERQDSDKTIIDTGVLFPMLNSRREWVTTGLLAPEVYYGSETEQLLNRWRNMSEEDKKREYENKRHNWLSSIAKGLGVVLLGGKGTLLGNYEYTQHVNSNSAMILSLKHKFLDKTPDDYTTIEQLGTYYHNYGALSGFKLQDVMEGTSATGNESNATKDDNGFALKHLTRFIGVRYSDWRKNKQGNDIPNATRLVIRKENTRLYNLKPFNAASSIDGKKELINLSMDNNALVINSKNHDFINTYEYYQHPYVVFKKNNTAFYQNFRNREYTLLNNKTYTTSNTEATVFGGDTYIAPIRYSNHIYLNSISGNRHKKVSIWKILTTAITFGLAIVTMFIPGLQGLSAWLVYAGAAALATGAILMGASAVVEANKYKEIYDKKWADGLDRSVHDIATHKTFISTRMGPQMKYDDDCLFWVGDVVGDFWLEGQYNASLRVMPRNHTTNFLKPLSPYMENNQEGTNSLFHGTKIRDVDIHIFSTPPDGYNVREGFTDPKTEVDRFFYNKIFDLTLSSNKKYKYKGVSLPIVYMLNADFNLNRRLKKFYQIPLTYDFCSTCVEKFPHRIYYSQQAFQEEKVDNYKVFLPNNYRDIEGETGEITNIFRMNNNLYIHTKEALWLLPRNYQERVTDQIVSFIGTGSYFEIPPQKLIDDETGLSAGTQHKWSSIKTPVGYFFVSANQSKVYLFDGNMPKPISDIGMKYWFGENLKLKTSSIDEDNPSYSNGYVSTYDSKYDRILLTKRDKNNSWTLSFSLLTNSWISFHSYVPNFYISSPNNLYSFFDNHIYKHNIKGEYGNIYGSICKHILEFTINNSPLQDKLWNNISFQTTCKEYNPSMDNYTVDNNTTFNSINLWNSYQASGELRLITKIEDEDYLLQQVNQTYSTLLERQEKNWFLNDFRNFKIDNVPTWNYSIINQSNLYVYLGDKLFNGNCINPNKEWYNQDVFRDKYLNVRLTYDNLENKKLITNFVIDNQQVSFN